MFRPILPIALSALLLALPALAADGPEPSYRLDCVPDVGRSESLADWLRLRLLLRGFDEETDHPALRLCFRIDAQQRLIPSPGMGVGYGGWGGRGWGGGYWGYGAWWAYDVEMVPVASLVAQRPDGSVYWQGSQDIADGSAAALQDALRRLVERLPLD
ncbi:hypothetical protein QU487_00685 [Crenobacter sp. SG2305]|uniref:hypothetical protein n=1 Tax=Crenobacter oryzisoli TaxID=3056844 RepID=UPI0025AA7AE1|nr:hypothetical protein [Crenobacter sp. SG2305]MDN0081275.1 hypothetical protein [Crenobacter sp. SG2305]